MTLTLFIVVLVVGATAVMALRLKSAANEIKAHRAVAEDQLWRRYNLVGDLISWATHEGGPDAAQSLDDIVAARAAIMKCRGDWTARLAAEDGLQRALNAFYRAADTDADIISSHEIIMIIAHLTTADDVIADQSARYTAAAAAFNRRIGGGLGAMLGRALGISPAPGMKLNVINAASRSKRNLIFYN